MQLHPTVFCQLNLANVATMRAAPAKPISNTDVVITTVSTVLVADVTISCFSPTTAIHGKTYLLLLLPHFCDHDDNDGGDGGDGGDGDRIRHNDDEHVNKLVFHPLLHSNDHSARFSHAF